MSIFWMVIFLFLGIWLGSALANSRWQLNSSAPARIKQGDHFYKVVKLSDPWSWEMVDIHRDDQEQSDE